MMAITTNYVAIDTFRLIWAVARARRDDLGLFWPFKTRPTVKHPRKVALLNPRYATLYGGPARFSIAHRLFHDGEAQLAR